MLRSGSPLRLDDLTRVDFAHAGVIRISAADTTASSTLDADTCTVKTPMTMGAALEETPPEEPRQLRSPPRGARVYSFADLQRAAADDARGVIFIGICRSGQHDKPGGRVQLNPGGNERQRLNDDAGIIVLTTLPVDNREYRSHAHSATTGTGIGLVIGCFRVAPEHMDIARTAAIPWAHQFSPRTGSLCH